jgi:hypothetical protein
MRKQNLRFLMIVFLLPLLVYALAACTGGATPPPTSPPPPTEAAPTEEKKEEAAAPTEEKKEEEAAPTKEKEEAAPTKEKEEEAAPAADGEPSLADLNFSSGLDTFSAYRSSLNVSVDGTSDETGDPVTANADILVEHIVDPQTLHVNMNVEGFGTGEEGALAIEIFDVDGTTYMNSPLLTEGQWMAVPSEGDSSEMLDSFSPEEFAKIPETATLDPDPVEVNGVETYHYSFDETTLPAEGEEQIESATGDLWVAVDGNYIVKYELTATGSFPGDGQQGPFTGDISILYELSDINGDFAITPPDEALEAESMGDMAPGKGTTDGTTEGTTETGETAAAGDEVAIDFDAKTGLEELTSYRSTLKMSVDGTKDNQPVSGEIDLLIEITREPEVLHMNMGIAGEMIADSGQDSVNLDIYFQDQTIYMQNPEDGTWMAIPSEGEEDLGALTQGFLKPEDLVDLPETAELAPETETVNGIETYHYSFSEADFTEKEMSVESAEGDIWVAVDGGYLVKFYVDAKGVTSTDPSEPFETGDFTLDYELLDVNSDFTIEVPAEALDAAGAGAPGGYPGGKEK